MANVFRIKQFTDNVLNPGADPSVELFNQFLDGESGVTITKTGELYIADTGRHVIWRLKEGLEPTVFAGKLNTPGFVNGEAADARFDQPKDMAADNTGNLYVFDTGSTRIRRIDTNGNVSTVTQVYPASKNVSIAVAPDGIIYAVTNSVDLT